MVDIAHLERVLRDNTIDPGKLANHLRTAATYYTNIKNEMPLDHASLADEFGRYAEQCVEWADLLEEGE